MRKNDERNPRHVRDSEKTCSQNRALAWVWTIARRWFGALCVYILTSFPRLRYLIPLSRVEEQSSYDEVGRSDTYDIDALSVVRYEATELDKRSNSKIMILLEKATQDFQVVYLWVATYNQIHQFEKIDIDDEYIDDSSFEENQLFQDFEKESLVNELSVAPFENVSYDEERQQQLELEMEKLLTEPSDDGFSFLDKSILRKDSPIPEWCGDYNLTPEELEQGKIVRYIPGIGWFVDE